MIGKCNKKWVDGFVLISFGLKSLPGSFGLEGKPQHLHFNVHIWYFTGLLVMKKLGFSLLIPLQTGWSKFDSLWMFPLQYSRIVLKHAIYRDPLSLVKFQIMFKCSEFMVKTGTSTGLRNCKNRCRCFRNNLLCRKSNAPKRWN